MKGSIYGETKHSGGKGGCSGPLVWLSAIAAGFSVHFSCQVEQRRALVALLRGALDHHLGRP